jgi:SOUL heme-binding protein
MGTVFGRESVAEPAFTVLLENSAGFAYQVRQYGVRYGAEAFYTSSGKSSDDNSPFMDLAKYIGVFGTPENEGQTPMAMTAPVVMERHGTKMAMTAPVIREENKMMFILPAEFDAMSKIPKPTNPNIRIVEIPAQVGVVHRYAGSFDEGKAAKMARDLAQHLDETIISTDYVMSNYQFWGFNPPFTLPMFRRNEIWVPLTQKQWSAWQQRSVANDTTALK